LDGAALDIMRDAQQAEPGQGEAPAERSNVVVLDDYRGSGRPGR